MAKSVEKVYGQALYEVAKESNDYDEIFADAKDVLTLCADEANLMVLLNNPRISPEEKDDILDKLFKESISEVLLDTIKLLVKNGRQKQIVSTLKYFIGKVKEDKKIGVVFVTSDEKLTKKDMKKIEDKLYETTGYEELEMNYKVDESLLGGLVIRINDRVVDSSLKTKLMQISRELTKVSLDKKMFD